MHSKKWVSQGNKREVLPSQDEEGENSAPG
jgi:hypothetical protein